MINSKHVIIGCGDVGRRIALQWIQKGMPTETIVGLVKSHASIDLCQSSGIQARQIDLDKERISLSELSQSHVYYLVPPQKEGVEDLRSRHLLNALSAQRIRPKKIVLISTTGVYGDCDGAWVTEQTKAQPQTERGRRRLDSEQQWSSWCEQVEIPLVILRVPGIYARSRIPKQRIEQGIPVVTPSECGFTNRVHADDLAAIAISAMQNAQAAGVFNATDGTPGKISEYLQAAAQVLDLPALPEISMRQAQKELSAGMLSYLKESRQISNKKMLSELNVKLRYPNFQEGLKFG